jgi:hypothetical protein
LDGYRVDAAVYGFRHNPLTGRPDVLECKGALHQGGPPDKPAAKRESGYDADTPLHDQFDRKHGRSWTGDSHGVIRNDMEVWHVRVPENLRPILLEFGGTEHSFVVLLIRSGAQRCARLHNNGWSALQQDFAQVGH